MVWVELVALGMQFGNDCSLRAPGTGVLFSLGIDVELGQEVLDNNLVIYGQKSRLEVLSGGQILVVVSLTWCLSDHSTA